MPFAAGTCPAPTKKISVRIVTIYGIMDKRFGEMILELPIRDRTPLQKPKITQPRNVPCGVNLPKMTAAMAINPCPTITDGRNWDTVASVTKAPASPDKKPEVMTQI